MPLKARLPLKGLPQQLCRVHAHAAGVLKPLGPLDQRPRIQRLVVHGEAEAEAQHWPMPLRNGTAPKPEAYLCRAHTALPAHGSWEAFVAGGRPHGSYNPQLTTLHAASGHKEQ